METIGVWNTVSKTQRCYQEKQAFVSRYSFEIALSSKGCNASDMNLMLYRFHGLGENTAVSLRIVKDSSGVKSYIVFRVATDYQLSSEEYDRFKSIMEKYLVKYYDCHYVDYNEYDCKIPSNMNEVTEIAKKEELYYGDEYPGNLGRQVFYSVRMIEPNAHMLESVGEDITMHDGDVVLDIVFEPTTFLGDEVNWVNDTINRLDDCSKGETLISKSGKVIWQGKPLPALDRPLACYKSLKERYESSKLFLSSIRVFTEKNSERLAKKIAGNIVYSQMNFQTFQKDSRMFDEQMETCYTSSISSFAGHLWDTIPEEDIPNRAQRLTHLFSAEEISVFFNLPSFANVPKGLENWEEYMQNDFLSNTYAFMSYSHKNTDEIKRLTHLLSLQDYRIWRDQYINAGTDWANYVANRLAQSNVFIGWITNDYVASTNCMDELNHARNHEKPLVLIFENREIQLPSGYEMRTGRFQRLYHSDYHSESEFIDALKITLKQYGCC